MKSYNNPRWNAYSISPGTGNRLLLGSFDSPVAAADCIEQYRRNELQIDGVIPGGYEIRMEKAA